MKSRICVIFLLPFSKGHDFEYVLVVLIACQLMLHHSRSAMGDRPPQSSSQRGIALPATPDVPSSLHISSRTLDGLELDSACVGDKEMPNAM